MLHILFLILKIIGIILAVILGLILLILCIVLFVPICYKTDLRGNGSARELTVHAKVSWLFGLIKAVFSLEHGKPYLYIKIAWKKLDGSEPEPKKETKTKQEHQVVSREENRNETNSETAETKHQENETVEKVEKVSAQSPEKIPAESRVSERTEKQSEKSAKIHEESAEEKRRKKEDRKEDQQNDSDTGSKIEQITEKIKCTYDEFCDKINEITEKKDRISEFLTNETHKNAFLKLQKEVIRLLKHLVPKKIQGDIVFGFEDPSWTGKLLAWISVIYPWIGEQIDITPDFEHRTLNGDLQIRGGLQVITPAVMAVRLILSKAVRRSFKDIRNFKL